jgi:hypothetical protein
VLFLLLIVSSNHGFSANQNVGLMIDFHEKVGWKVDRKYTTKRAQTNKSSGIRLFGAGFFDVCF